MTDNNGIHDINDIAAHVKVAFDLFFQDLLDKIAPDPALVAVPDFSVAAKVQDGISRWMVDLTSGKIRHYINVHRTADPEPLAFGTQILLTEHFPFANVDEDIENPPVKGSKGIIVGVFNFQETPAGDDDEAWDEYAEPAYYFVVESCPTHVFIGSQPMFEIL